MTDTILDHDILKLSLNGRLDMQGTGEIELPFTARTSTGTRPVIVDMSGVNFISSLGIRLLLTSAKESARRNKKLILFGLTQEVHDTIVLPGLNQLLSIAPNEAEAIQQATA